MPLHGKEFFPKRGNFFFQELMSKQARIDNCRKDSIWAISPRHIAFYNWINGNSIEIWSSNALHLDQCPPGTIFSKIVYCIYPIYVDSSKKINNYLFIKKNLKALFLKLLINSWNDKARKNGVFYVINLHFVWIFLVGIGSSFIQI